ncbi:MAG: cytochrome c oxidase subunit II [Pirellulales bacterium]|nr:cytochrome c oxidase subunit II [Pirellulales bacterium]
MSPFAEWINRGISIGLFAQAEKNFWLPEQASTFAPMVDKAFYFLLGISVFFFCLIVALMVAFVILYRRRPGVESQKTATHNGLLEMLWLGIPLIIVCVIFYQGFKTYLNIRVAPANAYEINVVARKWAYSFTYPNGHVDEVLYMPADEPVQLIMTSAPGDVSHGLSIPDFRVNMDIVPGRYTKIWFHALEEGEHQLFCTQYCGTGHSDMRTAVKVLKRPDFDKYLAEAENYLKTMPPEKAGEILFQRRGCTTCHTVDGTRDAAHVGPTLKGIWGHEAQFKAGPPQTVDENYIRESLLEPSAKIVAGYPDQMPTFKGLLKDEEIAAIIAYIKTLK